MRAVAFALAFGLLLSSAPAADWPMYRADAARSGYTPNTIPKKLSLHWRYRLPQKPMPAWPSSDRLAFDRACQPVIAGDGLYFGSSADGKVYALDARTGAVRWTFLTDGPVRFAPVIWRGRILVAGDDGWLVCLAAEDGRLVWRLRGGPRADMLLGNDRLISRWPARGGPVLVGDTVYFAAGIWPSEGIFVYAVDAASGKVLWRNDSSGAIEMGQPHPGAQAESGVAAQGYLAADGDRLLVSTGRAVPALFDRASGEFRSFPLQFYGKFGGSEVVAFDGRWFAHDVLFPSETEVKPQSIGRQMAVHPDWILGCKQGQLSAWNRRALWVETDTVDRTGKKVKSQSLSKPVWTLGLPHESAGAMIAAGDTAVIGGQGKVTLVDLAARSVAWTGEVDGVARGLAAANDRLYVSTENGVLYAFGSEAAAPQLAQQQQETPPADEEDAAVAKAAEEILRVSGVREGYCLDLGCGDGRLTMALAKRSTLRICAVDSDAGRVESLKRRLDAAGYYGTRVTVLQAALDQAPCPRWFADLVVSGRSLSEGEAAVPQAAAKKFQRPWGGVACLGKQGAMQIQKAGPLEGAGDWTHQYADPANSLCSDDARLRGPLRTLWFRDTDFVLPNRHGRGPAPLVREGRMIVEGLDGLRAVSIYNGRTLWEFPLPKILKPYHQDHLLGVAGTGSNLCMEGSRIYVAAGDRCLCLSAEDGAKLAEFPSPPGPDGKPGTWGYLACEGNTLIGSLCNEEHQVGYRFKSSDMSRLFTESALLFAMDARSGSVKWKYAVRDSLRHNSIAVGGGRVYLIDRPIAEVDIARLAPAKTKGPSKPEHQPGRLLALDLETGRVVWEARQAFGTLLALSVRHDALLMSYQPTSFQLDSERGGRMAVYRASDGTPLWDQAAKYRSRPILNDRTIYVQPGAWDLLTGSELPFKLTRSYGCGILAGSSRMLVFRSATLGYVDLDGERQTENYGGIRPGCWINAIPAGGLVLMADAASWCTCSYLNQATIALEPAPPGE